MSTSLLRAAVATILLAATALSPLSAQDSVAALMARIEGAQTPNRQGFDPLTLEQLMQRFRVPGVSIAVIKDYRIHWARGYGVADVATGRKVDTETLFQAASISKPVTAMAFLTAVRDEKASLDADVNTLLRSWKVPRTAATTDAPVTPRALFSHTSGSDDGFGFPGYDPAAPIPTLVQIIQGEKPSNVGAVVFGRPPFQGQKYSGGGTVIMQLAMTEALGKPFAELMRERVLEPLGMKESTYEQPLPLARDANATRGHNGGGMGMGAKWHVYPEQAPAGLWTTASDLARFAIEIQQSIQGKGKVLPATLGREMVTPVGVGPYAVGPAVDKRGEGWYFSHGGGNWGFRCDLLAHVRKGYGVVIMTNGDGGGALLGEIEARVAAAYGWDTLDKPIPR